jgi:hypothetical protein
MRRLRLRAGRGLAAGVAGLAVIGLTAVNAEAAPASGPSAVPRVVSAGTKPGALAVNSASTTAAAFRKFSSPASSSVTTHGPVAGTIRRTAAPAVQAATGGVTIYAESNPFCTAPGTGTQASPYCSIQQAVNAASAGDTVAVESNVGYSTNNSFTISTSGITVAGLGPQAWLNGEITIAGATNVTISDLMINGTGPDSIQITGSSAVTLDSDYIAGARAGTDGVSIDGTSSNVTVSRSFVNGSVNGGSTINIASGASHITLAGDLIAGGGIAATGVAGLAVAGDTIDRSCGGGVSVAGASTGASIENDVFEDAGYIPGSSDLMGEAVCSADGYGWAPDVNVTSSATAGTTADYNDFATTAGDTTEPYAWGGTDFATTAAFTTATGQGAHDLNDSTTFTPTDLRPNEPALMRVLPLYDSPAIGSANLSAPGELSSDYFGVSPYTTRGAVQFVAPNPTLAVGLTAEDTSALRTTLTSAISGFSYGLDYNTGLGNVYPLSITTDWGDGTQTTDTDTTSNTSYTATHPYTHPGIYTITQTLNDGDGDTAVNSVLVETAGSDYVADGPVRLLDTRDGTGGTSRPLTTAAPIKLSVIGVDGVPATATAVAINVTVTNSTGYGNVAVNPDGITPSGTSNLNYAAGQTVPNLVIVPIGADGKVQFTKQGPGQVDLIADMAGYFTAANAAGYTSAGPTRILDTRYGIGASSAKLTSSGYIKLQVSGANGVPGNVTAVAVNLTLTDSTGFGNVVAWPDGSPQPTASNLNYTAGLTVANAAIIPVTDGYIDIAKQGPGAVSMIADVDGYYTDGSGSAYVPVTPTRLFDSRTVTNGKLPADAAYELPIDQDSNGAKITDITGLVLNTTVTNVTGVGFVTVFPDNTAENGGVFVPPTASNLNFAAGTTVPNLTFATPGDAGLVDFYNGAQKSSLDLIVDAFGFYQND